LFVVVVCCLLFVVVVVVVVVCCLLLLFVYLSTCLLAFLPSSLLPSLFAFWSPMVNRTVFDVLLFLFNKYYFDGLDAFQQ
jgi:hypothetical protein